MNITIYPRHLRGEVTPPPSKSQTHRLLLAAALAPGQSMLENFALSEDVEATVRCLRALGAEVSCADGVCTVRGVRTPPEGLPAFDCGESGSTLRFLIPAALALAGGGVFSGHGRLMERPMGPYQALLDEKGAEWTKDGGALTVRGRLLPGVYRLPGNVSSQFITGLLYALPLLDGDSEILLTTPLESEGYVEMTLDALTLAGVTVEAAPDGGWRVPGRQRFAPLHQRIEGDWSQAAFYLAANGLGGQVTPHGLRTASRQGDRVAAAYSRRLSGRGTVVLDASQCPDLVPALAAQAALRDGETTRIAGAARLRMKESDRLAAITDELRRLGANLEQTPDGLIFRGVHALHSGTADSRGDHRIAMMLAIAAARADGPVTVTGAECVRKSYPGFWEDYEALGGAIERSDP